MLTTTVSAPQRLFETFPRLSKRRRGKLWVWLVLSFLVVWTTLPFLWMVSATFKTPLEVYRSPPTIIPAEPTLDAFRAVFALTGFWRFWFNSVLLSSTTLVIVMVLSTLAGFAFAKYAFPFRGLLLMFVLIPRILPRAGLMVPLYVKFADLGLLNTYWVLIISYVASGIPLATWLLSIAFRAVPSELQEAAEIDGATLWQHLRNVYLPVALPGVITAATLTMVDAWNEFPFVLAFTQGSQMRTLPYQLYLLRSTEGLENWPLVNAFALTTIVPIILFFLFFQRRVVNSMTSGAVK